MHEVIQGGEPKPTIYTRLDFKESPVLGFHGFERVQEITGNSFERMQRVQEELIKERPGYFYDKQIRRELNGGSKQSCINREFGKGSGS